MSLEETHAALDVLAEELAANYLQASRLDLNMVHGDKHLDKMKESILISSFEKDRYSRNILVIGAGCSANAYPDIPLASQAIDEIHKQIKVEHPAYENFESLVDDKNEKSVESSGEGKEFHLLDGLRDKYINEHRKLKLHSPDYGTGDETIDFETSLNLLAKIIPISRVRELIKTIYDHRHGPMMFYELVAHLFKHRFIDAIINFNFDEYLDQSIREELGKEGYDEILSDGDCRPITELSTNGRLRQPLYIKPHGTASHKSTMRFTKDQYYELPLDMRVFLSELISCRKEPEPGKRYVNLMTVGFEMKSLEFNEILNESLPYDSNLFSFYFHNEEKTSEEVVVDRRELYDKHFKREEKNLKYHFIGHEFFKEDVTPGGWSPEWNTPTLGSVFLKLHEKIRFHYKSPFQPRRVSRHEVLPTIFGGEVFNAAFEEVSGLKGEKLANARKDYFKSSAYFKDRVVIEIVMAFTKNKGRLDLPLLMMGRVGEYYALYQSKAEEAVSMLELIKDLFDTDDKAHRLTLSDQIVSEAPAKKLEDLFDEFANGTVLSEYLTRYFQLVKSNPALKDYLMKRLLNIFKSKRSNIKSMLRGTIHHVFEKYSSTNLLNTDLSIDLHFYESLRGHEHVNDIRMIAESGNKLANFLGDLMDRPGINVKLILADPEPELKDLDRKRYKALKRIYLRHYYQVEEKENQRRLSDSEIKSALERLNIEVRFRRINRHNHHMVLFSNVNGDGINWDLQEGVNRGIYYFQQGLNENINPIRIIEKENLISLHSRFDDYWKKAAWGSLVED